MYFNLYFNSYIQFSDFLCTLCLILGSDMLLVILKMAAVVVNPIYHKSLISISQEDQTQNTSQQDVLCDLLCFKESWCSLDHHLFPKSRPTSQWELSKIVAFFCFCSDATSPAKMSYQFEMRKIRRPWQNTKTKPGVDYSDQAAESKQSAPLVISMVFI